MVYGNGESGAHHRNAVDHLLLPLSCYIQRWKSRMPIANPKGESIISNEGVDCIGHLDVKFINAKKKPPKRGQRFTATG